MKQYSYKVVTAPTTEPVSLSEVKNHLKIDHNDEDNYLSALISAARQWCEEFLWRYLLNTEAELFINEFTKTIYVGRGCNEITEIAYLDDDSVYQVIPNSNYYLDLHSQPAVIEFNNYSLPVTTKKLNLLRIKIKAGFGDDASDIPAPIKSAILLIVGHLYENRQDEITGTIVSALQFNSKYLLLPYRINTFL